MRHLVRVLGFAVALSLASASPFAPISAVAAGTTLYGGYFGGNAQSNGIDGYVRQSGVVSEINTAHFVYLSASNCVIGGNCQSWEQVGTYQGDFLCCSSEYAVHVYTEDQNACGSYYARDWGPPPTPDYPFYVTYEGTASFVKRCPDGRLVHAWTWNFRMGGWGNTPFWTGTQTVTLVYPVGETETLAGATYGTDYFGCDHSKSCGNPSFGLHVYNGTTWSAWTGAWLVEDGTGPPPWVHTYVSNWAYATCPVQC